MKEPFDILSKVERVEAPPFLYTRILQRIASLKEEKVQPAFAFSVLLSLVLVVLLNLTSFMHHQSEPQKGVQAFGFLQPHNELYYD